jgi:TRAP-type C4-dicarboxylate transport system permease small subunit
MDYMNLFDRLIRTLTWRTAQIGQAALFFAMIIIVANVLSRIPWNPVPGTVELTEMAGAVLLAAGVAYTAAMKGHIMVGFFVDRYSPRVQAIVDIITNAISLFFIYLLARETFVFGGRMMARGFVTADLLIPIYPIIYLVGISFIMLSLVVLRDLIKAAILAVKGGKTA